MTSKIETFARLHIPGNPLILFNIWDAGSAQVAARAGAKAIATGSAQVFTLDARTREWTAPNRRHGSLPRNFTLTASEGSKHDHLIQPDWVTVTTMSSRWIRSSPVTSSLPATLGGLKTTW